MSTEHRTPAPGAAAAPHVRADGTHAPSADHVKPHPYGKPGARQPAGHSGPAIGAPAAGPAAFMSVLQLAMLTVVVVASLRSLPAIATYGLGSVTLFIIPAILFLVPTALVAAELATGWKGGVFTWAREAFGERVGFVAIWLQWIQNVVWYPTQIAFIAASLSFVVSDQRLASNGVYTAIVILVLYWGSTLITLAGGNLFAKVGSWSGIFGTILPAVLLIVFGVVWLATGERSETSLEASAVIPPWTGIASIVLIVSNVLAYAGMEVNAVHANDLKNPGRGFPRSIAVATVLILLVFILPTIAISVAVPKKELGVTNGINLAFEQFFDHWGMGWGTPVISLLIALGAFASVVSWIAGPSRGLLAAARTGLLPPALQRRNKAGVQSGILAVQGGIVTLLALLFVLVPNGNTAFIALVDMAAALYLIMYMIMFAAAIRLRRSQPDVVRTYRTPAMKLVAGVGFVACAVAFVLAFIRPSGFTGLSEVAYPLVVAAVVVVLGGPPLLFYARRRPTWDRRTAEERATTDDVLVNPPDTPAPTSAPRTAAGG
ncbi:MAG: amino acid permease [Cellulomonas iranensis]|uniref:Glutamate/gamma-aminobutyrate antiporter n=1 Tax=Cellulomonas iranensis TaxID=76862 RepID=A0ABU0GKR8_9CELL|nr:MULTISPECIES: APC family permease [Cellulomonas]MBO9569996.1 amino acid permease [Cellulomonas iranensis]MDQ0425959.1 putative glutamate/gamma-aminobutyrate antiporter [Cellulomonas iranensis]TFH71803.1 amino acid permease [Cellulomonas sp. HD19AZ1]